MSLDYDNDDSYFNMNEMEYRNDYVDVPVRARQYDLTPNIIPPSEKR